VVNEVKSGKGAFGFNAASEKYEDLLEAGVARELARMVLPVNIYTEFYWTVDLWNLMHFLRLRIDSHAQYEIQVYGNAILQLIKDNCELGYAIEAFEDYILNAPKFTRYEAQVVVDIIRQHGLTAEVISKVKEHLEMSKREKSESRLVEFLERGTDEGQQDNQINNSENEE